MDSGSYYNPYTGTTFFGFFIQLFSRLWQFIKGDIGWHQLATDEIQILVLSGVAISSALVGTFLILRKMTMLANSLSHTILIGIVMAFLVTQRGVLAQGESGAISINIEVMLIAALMMGLLTTFFTEFLTHVAKLQEDASTGIVFTSLFALGIVAVTLLTRNAHIGTEVVMGNVDALQLSDCYLVYLVLAINIVLFLVFFKEYKITTFDTGLARAFGMHPTFFNYLLMAQVSATTIAAFRAVGVLMVLAFITGPALAARLLTHRLKSMLWIASLLGVIASFVGVGLSRHFLTVYDMPLTTSGLVVCVILLIYVAAVGYSAVIERRVTQHNTQFTGR